jgi:hypothetical protein
MEDRRHTTACSYAKRELSLRDRPQQHPGGCGRWKPVKSVILHPPLQHPMVFLYLK